jgi:hypothetical protein
MPARKRGRQPEPRPELTPGQKVAVLAGNGWRHEQIALALAMPLTELERRYAHELRDGPAEMRSAVLEAVARAALAGITSAARLYFEQTGRFADGSQ